MTRFGDPYYAEGGSAKGIVAKFSSNGEQFVIVLKRGNLRDNTNEYSLVLFETARAFHQPTPRTLVSMSSSSNRPAIHNVVWLNDNNTLLFLGEHPRETSQLYSVQCGSKRLTKLTNHATNLTSFAATPSGDEIVYVTENEVSSLVNDGVSRNGFNVTHEWLSDLIRESSGGGEDGEHSLFIKRRGNRQEIEIKLEGRLLSSEERTMALSPDGAHLLIQTMASHISQTWGQYEDQFLQAIIHHPAKRGAQTSGIYQYELVDTRTGASTLLVDAPISSFGSEIAWSPDSRSAVISNAYLPLNVDSPTEQKRRKAHTFLLEYKIPSGEVLTISDEDLLLLRWDPNVNAVICNVGRADSLNGKNTPKIYFRKKGETWTRMGTLGEARTPSLPDIVLEENMNTPPKLFVIAPTGGQKSLLMDLNPQFRDFALATVEEVSWKTSRGDEIKGGLYWPVGYIASRKYPLVIQTHGWISNKFWMDGVFMTAFAAQPLAGKGFFVLQLDELPNWHLSGTPEEAPSAMAAYESAIDYLDGRGLIDRKLVGIIGFSRTCYYVKHMLAFSKYRIAAAVIADGWDADYFQYFAFSNGSPDAAAGDEALNGGEPFGDAMSSWTKRVSAFHMDQVQAPVRIQALNPGSLLGEWNWFSGLYRLGKPVEMVYLPGGVHILEKPWERMVSQQGDVDWFCFWLKGEENPDPAKAEQYKRWRELRGLSRPATASVSTQ
ncbi:MAG: hypothetical protein WBM24_23520 [Candidatus Sulfotelmatobacter sp.]